MLIFGRFKFSSVRWHRESWIHNELNEKARRCRWRARKDEICIIFADTCGMLGKVAIAGWLILIVNSIIARLTLADLTQKRFKTLSNGASLISFFLLKRSWIAATRRHNAHIFFRTACAIRKGREKEKQNEIRWLFIRRLIVAQLFASLFGFYRVGVRWRLANINKDAICTSLSLPALCCVNNNERLWLRLLLL